MYVKSGFPPGYLSLADAERAQRNMIQAHARAYDNIKRFSSKPVGLIYSFIWFELFGGPPEVAESVKNTRLYVFTDMITKGVSHVSKEYRKDLASRLDWLGVNYYSRVVFQFVNGKPVLKPGYGYTCTPRGYSPAGNPCSDFGWEAYPEGLYLLLKELFNRYRVDLIVTENGVSDSRDALRPAYLVSHVYNVWKAVNEGIPVKGYLHWSLTDNYEWAQGFRQRFGLVMVDFKTKKRYLRPSALVFREIARTNGIPEELEHLVMMQ